MQGATRRTTPNGAAAAAAAAAPARPHSLPEMIIRAYGLRYGLRELQPVEERGDTLLRAGMEDVVFRSAGNGNGGEEVRTYGQLFAVAAAAKGRPAVPVERFGTVDEEATVDGLTVVRCDEGQMEAVRAVQLVVVRKTAEVLDRLLDEAYRGGRGEKSAAGPDFTVQLEDEAEEEDAMVSSGKTKETRNTSAAKSTTKTTAKDVSTKSKSPAPAGSTAPPNPQDATTATEPVQPDDALTKYAEIHLHRVLAAACIPYYKYLSLRTVRFSDTASNTSTLPHPTITFHALRVVQTWLYNPLRIGEYLELAEPHAHLYLLGICKRQDRNGFPPPMATARTLVEVARAADYLGLDELAAWSARVLRRLCHGLEKCTGNRCRAMVPFVLQKIWEGGGLGLPVELAEDAKRFIAGNPETMWKRPVIAMADELVAEVVEAFAELHGREMARKVPVAGDVRRKKKDGENAGTGRVVVWWNAYVAVSKVRASVKSSVWSNRDHQRRWDEKLLGPAIEHCVHALAKGFDDPRLAEELNAKMAAQDFERGLVVELLMLVTMASVVGREESAVPIDRPPLNRKTVRAVFEGIVNLRTWDGWDTEWGVAERRVLDFLRREWMTIVVGGEGGFERWRPAMVTVVSRKLRVSVDELLGRNQKRQGPASSKGKAVVKDRLGNDVQVDVGGKAPSGVTVLRPEAVEFVPSGQDQADDS